VIRQENSDFSPSSPPPLPLFAAETGLAPESPRWRRAPARVVRQAWDRIPFLSGSRPLSTRLQWPMFENTYWRLCRARSVEAFQWAPYRNGASSWKEFQGKGMFRCGKGSGPGFHKDIFHFLRLYACPLRVIWECAGGQPLTHEKKQTKYNFL